MNLRGLKQNIYCRWREFLREPSAILFVVIMPPIWIGLLGNIFTSDKLSSHNIGYVLGSDKEIREVLHEDAAIKMTVAELPQLFTLIKKGTINTIVEVKDKQATYYLDENNTSGIQAKLYTDNVIQKFHNRQNPVRTVIKQSPKTMRYIDFFIPGLLAFSIMNASFFGVGMMIVSHRRENLLKRFLVTPMQPLVYILSWIVGRLSILLVESSVIILAGVLFFNFQIKGNIFSFIFLSAIGAATFTAIATAMSSMGRNTSTSYSIINIITLPLSLFSGIWFHASFLPEWLAKACSYLPLAPLADGLRSISVEGATFYSVMPQIFLLLIYTAIATFLAKVLFRWH